MQILSRIPLFRSHIYSRNVLSLLGWILLATVLEALGRRSGSELIDIAALFSIAAAFSATYVAHRRQAIAWVTSLSGVAPWLLRRLQTLAIQYGIDYSEEPPIRAGIPGYMSGGLLFLAVLTGLVLCFAGSFPGVVRHAISSTFYLMHLLGVALLWAALIAGTWICVILCFALVHDTIVGRYAGSRPRSLKLELWIHASLLALVLVAGVTMPHWIPLAGLIAIGVTIAVRTIFPFGTSLTLLWRYRRGGEMRSIPLRYIAGGELVLFILFAVLLQVFATGSYVLFPTAELTGPPVTVALGRIFSWSAVVTAAALGSVSLNALRLGILRQIVAHRAPRLYIHGFTNPRMRRSIRQDAKTAGWRVAFKPKQPRPTDVQLSLSTDASLRHAIAIPEGWPKPVGSDHLFDEHWLACFARRCETQHRRILISALEKLFKRAARQKFQQGEGFWVGPQHWFLLGLCRDSHEEDLDFREGTILSQTIGLPYHRILPPETRYHFERVMQDVQIDLIFVEDGVGFRGLRRALHAIYQIQEVFGSQCQVTEHHFRGLPGVRAILHEFTLDNPYISSKYPEPDYTDLARGRILHLFKDRGRDLDVSDVPTDVTSNPLSLVGV